jgi:hypothetical protein
MVILLQFCLFEIVEAQNRRYIRSHEYMAMLEKQDSNVAKQRQFLEEKIEATYRSVKVPINPVIPVIFHVFYHTDAQKIAASVLMDQIDALNRDFGYTVNNFTHEAIENEGFNQVRNHIGLQFCMPSFSKDSSAINYYPIKNATWQFDNAMKDPNKGGIRPWNPQQFMNVYILDLHDTLAVAGYAQMPGGADSTDAIVMDYRFIGNAKAPYNKGRTLVHLVGNWLGLYSIWGVGGCNGPGDYVLDTPPHNAPNFGCPQYQHLSTCGQKTRIVEQTMNLMDASDDECLAFFTTIQKYRLHACLQLARSKLIKQEFNCRESEKANASTSKTNITKIVGTATQILSNEVLVYPNPGNNFVHIQLNLSQSTPFRVQITDLNGREIYQNEYQNGKQNIRLPTRNWQNGIYYLSIIQKNTLIHSEKMAIQH